MALERRGDGVIARRLAAPESFQGFGGERPEQRQLAGPVGHVAQAGLLVERVAAEVLDHLR